MSEHPAVYASLRLASAIVPAPAEKRARAKCDRDVKLHLPEAVYDDLARVARADSRAVSEYIRVLLERHLYGTVGAGN
ncbi:MAG: hypothetical protein IPL99_12015 [Candidatus Competibacteraceae bacterium]|nr:hypothetical protein [Candidatus Competibacteraceae bacterium]